MKKNTLLSFVILLVLGVCNANSVWAQMLLKEIALEQQIDKSSLVVEGKVIAKKSFWDANYHNIYTANTIEVYKLFKGEQLAYIEIITPGGHVGGQLEVVSPSLKLRVGDVGVFTLHDNDIPFSDDDTTLNKKFKAYSSLQGFYKYNINNNIAANTFSSKQGISKSFYSEIMHYTKTGFIEISGFDIAEKQKKSANSKSVLAPSNIIFSPTTSTAGTKSVLTITGTGFGNNQGKVGFSDADQGGGGNYVDALDTQVLTWSDTEITVEIPSEAGTGKIRITHEDTTSEVSDDDLTITYSQLNTVSDFFSVDQATEYAYPTRHIQGTGNTIGGYTWEMFTDFFNDSDVTGAKASFERALETWRCTTKVNWTISANPTTVDVAANDAVNVIRFDNMAVPTDNLPEGIAGRCTSRFSGCGVQGLPATANYHVTELDIVFDAETNWETGPNVAIGSKFDFESVALHELGHGHQLGHVIEPTGAVMHYQFFNAENIRTLTVGDIAGAGDVHNRSTTTSICGETAMTDHASSCTLNYDNEDLNKAINIYPNPTSGSFFIINMSSIKLDKAIIYDVSGRLVFEQNVSNTLQETSIDLNNISKGIYFVNILSSKESVTKKIVLE